jgi:hypothetical protein
MDIEIALLQSTENDLKFPVLLVQIINNIQLGYQSDGLIIHFSGPSSGCGNDLNILADSRFIRELQLALNLANVDIQLDLVADKI